MKHSRFYLFVFVLAVLTAAAVHTAVTAYTGQVYKATHRSAKP